MPDAIPKPLSSVPNLELFADSLPFPVGLLLREDGDGGVHPRSIAALWLYDQVRHPMD